MQNETKYPCEMKNCELYRPIQIEFEPENRGMFSYSPARYGIGIVSCQYCAHFEGFNLYRKKEL